MARKLEIGFELQGISNTAASLPERTPFDVPLGFFASFPDKILKIIRSEEGEAEELPPVLRGLSHVPTFQVPPGYFDGFADRFLPYVHEREAIEGAEPELPGWLEALRGRMPFTVPDGYLESLAGSAFDRISEGEAKDVAAELQGASPFLAGLRDELTYTGPEVPDGYFADFPLAMLEKVRREDRDAAVKPEGGRVVSMQLHRFLAAAVSIGVVLTSAVWGYHLYERPAAWGGVAAIRTEDQFNAALAKVSDQDILEYLKNSADGNDVDVVASAVDDDQLPTEDQYLDGSQSVDELLKKDARAAGAYQP